VTNRASWLASTAVYVQTELAAARTVYCHLDTDLTAQTVLHA